MLKKIANHVNISTITRAKSKAIAYDEGITYFKSKFSTLRKVIV